MNEWVYVLGGCATAIAVAVVTGWWRWALTPWTINAKRMTVRQLGLMVSDPSDVQRVDSILAGFAGGFNRMMARASWQTWQEYCASLPALLRPFAEEGAAMGYTPRRLFRYRPAAFERDIVRPRPEFRYLHYVGLGFWSGMRNHSVRKLERVTAGLDPLHRFLCFDGFGFKVAFFDDPQDDAALGKLDAFSGYARDVAYQGVGRAFFFRFMDRPDLFVERVAKLGENAVDVAAGAGLAAVFVNPDRLEVARRWAEQMPEGWKPHFHLGMCFGLKARSINDLDGFEKNLQRLDRAGQDAVWASIRECDRVELLVRADGETDGYRRWRSRVTEWMGENVEYPLAGVRHGSRAKGAGSSSERAVRSGG